MQNNLTFFEILFIIHLIMDWLFQTTWEAENKSKKWLNLFVHSFVYTIGFTPAFVYFKINFIWLLFIFISHTILDHRTFERWWIKTIKRKNLKEELDFHERILLLGVDQTFHLAILAMIALLR